MVPSPSAAPSAGNEFSSTSSNGERRPVGIATDSTPPTGSSNEFSSTSPNGERRPVGIATDSTPPIGSNKKTSPLPPHLQLLLLHSSSTTLSDVANGSMFFF